MATRYRAAAKANTEPNRPQNQTEHHLESAQYRLTVAEAEVVEARAERNRLLMEMWEQGHTQPELAARLTRASVKAGGPEIHATLVQKACWTARNGH